MNNELLFKNNKRFLSSLWKRILLILAVFGPATITAMADNDAGGIATYSLAGAKLGYPILFLLPIGPCLDAWGESLASHRDLDQDDRAEIFAALAAGCRKIPGQVGYYRAIAGMAAGTSLDQLAKRLSAGARQALKDPEIKRHLQLRRASFESSLRKQAQATLGQVWR